MLADGLPIPPTFEAVAAWAGAGRVVRATEFDVAAWELPEAQKLALISCGVPLIEDIVGRVSFHAGPTMYRLAFGEGGPAPTWHYGAMAVTGEVLLASPSDGSTAFVNSTIIHWLCSLHMVGSWLTSSTALDTWDESPEAEDAARAELDNLMHRISALDPPAFGEGNHETHLWPGLLDRWLY